ncbi:MAG: hypothetical protein JXB62_13410 [Pirellulales bacterium]|nr:hypothetical protein [Pirellulales bacterium]
MRIIILTQEENLYLPRSFATLCRALGPEIIGIVASPAMSTHGGAVKGFLKHFRLFGLKGTWLMGWRVARARLLARLTRPRPDREVYSIRQVADAFAIPYHRVGKVRDESFLQLLDHYRPDLLISISCPQIIGKKIRDRIPQGCINVHGAPLPKYRGLMPTFWALRNGETTTAVSVHDLGAKLDDGAILVQKEVEIARNDTWDSLVRKTKAAGVEALLEAIQQLKDGTVQRKPNRQEEATYFSFPTVCDQREFLAAGRRFF